MTDPATAIAESSELAVARRFYQVFHFLARHLDQLATAAAQASSHGIVEALRQAGYADKVARAVDSLTPVFEAGGQQVVGTGMQKAALRVSFDRKNAKTQRTLDSYRLSLIRQISDDQERAVHAVITRAMADGKAPKAMVNAIRDVVGLTRWQGLQVQTYRHELENLIPAALRRQLRDQRFDPAVERAIATGTPLGEAVIDRYVGRYRDNWQRYRAMTIARTETIRAVGLGARAAVEQSLDASDDFDVERTWVATPGGRTRDTHKILDGQTVIGMDTAFLLPDGRSIRYPHDPEAPAEEVCNCRCTIHYRLVPRITGPSAAAF